MTETRGASIRTCDCKNPGQDRLHGQGLRVHNYGPKAHNGNPGWRCTVCSKTKPAGPT